MEISFADLGLTGKVKVHDQICNGGSLILVQLENEHPEGKGTYMPNSYFSFLQKKALDLGVRVPYFFSEVHHGSDPAGLHDGPFDNDKRPNPWMSTEFWSVWYSNYGSTIKDADTYGRRTWKVIRDGGGGYNYYMAHGGSNFGYTNDDEDAASYDYGAAVGQSGDLRPIYYQFKKNALFARAFQAILANAKNAPGLYQDIVADTAIKVSARHSAYGDIAFLDNPGNHVVDARLIIAGEPIPSTGALRLSPGEILPVVRHFELGKDIVLDWAAVRVLGMSTSANNKTIVIYGDEGSAAALRFSAKEGNIDLLKGKEGFSLKGGKITLNPVFDGQKPTVYSFKAGGQTIQIIAVNKVLVDRTWLLNAGQKEYVVIGPEFVGDVTAKKDVLNLETEHFWEQTTTSPLWVYDGEGEKRQLKFTGAKGSYGETLSFKTAWLWRDAGLPADLDFDDRRWLRKQQAPQMGADGDNTCYAWYRTLIDVPKTGQYILKVREGGDRATVYIDQVKTISVDIRKETPFPLLAGKHHFVVFTSHAGRDKFFNHIGEAMHKNAKGLSGEVYLQNGKTNYLDHWKILLAGSLEDSRRDIPSFEQALPYQINDDVLKNKRGFAWFQTEIPLREGQEPRSVFCRGFNDAVLLFVNGKQVLSKMKNESFEINLSGLFKQGERNTLTVFGVHDRTYYRGGLTNNVEIVYDNPGDVHLSDWAMKGGPGDEAGVSGWRTMVDLRSDRPVFFKNSFNIVDPQSAVHPVWRISYEGLSRGSIWINGHNLGRYPEKISVKSLYIPECWLLKGENKVVIFDEDGKAPTDIHIIAEKAACRTIEKRVYQF